MTSRRQAAYFDLGVEYGIAVARANDLAKSRPNVRALAERIVREVLRTGVARNEAVEAALVAAWTTLGGVSGRAPEAATGALSR